jgi:hypothetical protein
MRDVILLELSGLEVRSVIAESILLEHQLLISIGRVGVHQIYKFGIASSPDCVRCSSSPAVWCMQITANSLMKTLATHHAA